MNVIKPVLHHVTLKTSRLDEMIAWYGVAIGAKAQFRDAHAAWLTNDGANHRLAFLSVPGLRDDPEKTPHNGMHHSAYEYASFADLISSYERLRDAGVQPKFCLDHGLTTSIYYQDPDGNYLELQCDSFGDWSASAEWMRTSPDFAANPIGVFFDPDKVLAFFRTGVSYADVQKAIRAEEFMPDPVPAGIGLPG
jgi:catechol 2,3-dioxygenase